MHLPPVPSLHLTQLEGLSTENILYNLKNDLKYSRYKLLPKDGFGDPLGFEFFTLIKKKVQDANFLELYDDSNKLLLNKVGIALFPKLH